MEKILTIVLIITSASALGQSNNIAIGGDRYMSPYVAPDTTTYSTEDICSLMSKIDTTGGFYYSQDGINWFHNKYGTSNIPVGGSYVYIYPRREKIKK